MMDIGGIFYLAAVVIGIIFAWKYSKGIEEAGLEAI